MRHQGGRGKIAAAVSCTSALLASAVMALVAPATAEAAQHSSVLRCGDVITSDITLTRDLGVCAGDGLIVGAPNVTVNLNHHHISGSDAAGTAAIRDSGYARLKVFGGVLQHFDTGVDFRNANHLLVEATTIHDTPKFGILLVHTNDGTVTASHILGAGLSGIQLVSTNHYAFVGNKLSQNGDGLAMYESSYNLIADNTSSDSGAGIDLVHSSNYNRILRNTTDREQDTGVLLDDHVNGNVIANNHATGNGFAGIGVGSSNGTVVIGNRVNDNLGSGIVVETSTHVLVIGNVANRNGTSPPGCVPDCPLLDDGIHVEAPGTTLTANRANFNADLGIDAVVGVTDGGQNVAHRNGDTRECTNVACS